MSQLTSCKTPFLLITKTNKRKKDFMSTYQWRIDSPIGPIRIIQTNDAITALYLDAKTGHPQKEALNPTLCPESKTSLLALTVTQLDEYFQGKRKSFSIPLNPSGTPFQKKCWDMLLTIPYGQTRSYKEIAAAIGNEKACRAVGMANHRNPISILIPCHRVIGANGALIGYGGGLPAKEYLLKLEGVL